MNIAIFSSRESPDVLARTITAALEAEGTERVRCDVIVNGNPGLAAEMAALLAGRTGLMRDRQRLRIIDVPVPDKAYAWNTYIHDIWEPAEITFFIDGYARTKSNSLASIQRGVLADPRRLGGTGVPSVGRSAKALKARLLHEGGFHGNLYAIRRGVIEHFRRVDFRLPLGIYRTDPTVGAAVCFNLDPASNTWDAKRIFVDPDATWDFTPLSMWSLKDLRTQFRRMKRQYLGRLETLAVRTHLRDERALPEKLPRTSYDMIMDWARRHPDMSKQLFRSNPLYYLAYTKLEPFREPDAATRQWSVVATFSRP